MKQYKCEKVINFFICLLFLVCALYQEPVLVPVFPSDIDTGEYYVRAHISNSEDAKPEELSDKGEQIINSIRESSVRRLSGGPRCYDEERLISDHDVFLRLWFTTARTLLFCLGADALFRNILSYIWSQIGT